MMTKKQLNNRITIEQYLYRLFVKMDWNSYTEKTITSKGIKIKRITFKYDGFTREEDITEEEYKRWRKIKPSMIHMKIGEKIEEKKENDKEDDFIKP